MKDIQNKAERIFLFICCAIFLFMGIQPMYIDAAENADNVARNSVWPDEPSVTGESCIVMESSTGTILYGKNMHDIHYPASITKI